MGKVQKYKRGIGAFISSEKGQRFFNFAYSIGAAIVIWGALFKILHLPGGNALLSLGMGTEVLMFLLTAFDRPPREYHWEEVFPVLDSKDPEDRPEIAGANGGAGVVINGGGAVGGTIVGGTVISGGVAAEDGDAGVPSGTVIVQAPSVADAKAAAGIPAGINLNEDDAQSLSESIAKMSAAADQLSRMAELTSATQAYLDQIAGIAADMQQLRQTTQALNAVSDTILQSYQAITANSNQISDAATGYAEQMQTLNRNIAGLNTIYEIQLKSVSSQIDSIDRVNRGIKDIRDMYEKSATQSTRYCEETERMARYMQQLNSVYEKMIHAMTINMYGQMPGAAPMAPVTPSTPDSEA